MAIEKVINITTTTKGVDKATEQVNKLNSSLKTYKPQQVMLRKE